MKIYVGIIAYNEEILIEASLRSVYDYVDEIIVIDGSYWGPSTDRTAEIVQSIGPKIKLFKETFNKVGITTAIERMQRQMYLDKMEKGKNNWCITQDADEVWDDGNIGRLIDYIRHADSQIIHFRYMWLHFFMDCWHYLSGVKASKPRPMGAFRLLPGTKQLDYGASLRIGNSNVTVDRLKPPKGVVLKDVKIFHYGHARTRERHIFKAHYNFMRDIGKRRSKSGYRIDQWEEFCKNVVLPGRNKKENFQAANIKEYTGPQPKYIQPLIGTFWKKQND